MNEIKADLYRYTKRVTLSNFIIAIFKYPSFKYTFCMRVCKKLKRNLFYKYTFLIPFMFLLRRYRYKYGLQIPYSLDIAKGLYIVHWGGIVINPNCKIGKNLTISQGVTLGQTNRGSKKGSPIIGDNVYIGPGAKIIGKIRIGNNCAIGANCVVTKDVPDNAVVVGIPGEVISFNGSEGYIHNQFNNSID